MDVEDVTALTFTSMRTALFKGTEVLVIINSILIHNY